MTREHRDKMVAHFVEESANGKKFYKSKYIARVLGITAKEVGHNMSVIAAEHPEITIEKWGYSRSTTWRITVGKAKSKTGAIMVEA